MSAYGIGADVATLDGEKKRQNTSTTTVPQTLIKWIPGEAVTFYAAILGIGSAQRELTGEETAQEMLERIDAGSFGWFALGAVITAALVVLGTATSRDDGARVSKLAVAVRIVLALAAFTLWTSALPGSWPYQWTVVRDVGAAYGALLIVIGLIFTALAERATRRLSL